MIFDAIEKIHQIFIDKLLLISQGLDIVSEVDPFLVVLLRILKILLLVGSELLHFVGIAPDQLHHRAVFDAVEQGILVEEVGLLQGLEDLKLVALEEVAAGDGFVLLAE